MQFTGVTYKRTLEPQGDHFDPLEFFKLCNCGQIKTLSFHIPKLFL